jgi:hypothetical protein
VGPHEDHADQLTNGAVVTAWCSCSNSPASGARCRHEGAALVADRRARVRFKGECGTLANGPAQFRNKFEFSRNTVYALYLL